MFKLFDMEKMQDYADVLAVPCFGLLVYYFITKFHRTLFENFLLFFACIGFLFDILMMIKMIKKNDKNNNIL